ncbi:hypothetical protein [Microtetraspora sp. NBRC 16547]|uniref:hypothetical protein n=1 Tax=Microtetraspora sp. NBRC 16547 TaxID=3030993 RepID=UPI00249FD753|nr:hypothetical protein [Microtetraspora sp. NBRC 16547]GLW96625.1 hypothetical protein Misp02_07120 [Microtetraspora sp. NBRC 16547]
MSYVIRYSKEAGAQADDLPIESAAPLALLLERIRQDPWHYPQYNIAEFPDLRAAFFCSSGLAVFHVSERRRTITIVHITWLD